jgi:hypothetical protein
MEPVGGYDKARKLLKEGFGNKYVVKEAWTKKVAEGHAISIQDKGLHDKADCLRNCVETLEAMENVSEINVQTILVKTVERLPVYLQIRWRREVREIKRKKDRDPNIGDLASFVEEAAEEANDPVCGKPKYVKSKPALAGDSNVKHSMSKRRNAIFAVSAEVKASSHTAVNSSTVEASNNKTCPLCTAELALYLCKQFLGMNVDERMNTARTKHLCFNCLKEGHTAMHCKSPRTCSVSGCGGRHTKFLHRVKT